MVELLSKVWWEVESGLWNLFTASVLNVFCLLWSSADDHTASVEILYSGIKGEQLRVLFLYSSLPPSRILPLVPSTSAIQLQVISCLFG